MGDEETWGRAEVIDLAAEREWRRVSVLCDLERWAEEAVERVGVDTVAVGGGSVLSLELARVDGGQSAYADVAARVGAAVLCRPPDVFGLLLAERAWCEAERRVAQNAAEVSEGEEQLHALGRADALGVVFRQLGTVLGRAVSSPEFAPSIPLEVKHGRDDDPVER